MTKQMTIVVIGALRVNNLLYSFKIYVIHSVLFETYVFNAKGKCLCLKIQNGLWIIASVNYRKYILNNKRYLGE